MLALTAAKTSRPKGGRAPFSRGTPTGVNLKEALDANLVGAFEERRISQTQLSRVHPLRRLVVFRLVLCGQQTSYLRQSG